MTDLSHDTPTDEAGPVWFHRLRRGVDGITVALNVAGTVLILLVMLLVNFDVIGRNLFLNPISGVPEMVSMSIVAIVFLQIAQTFRKGRLTRTDAVLGMVERRALRVRVLMDLIYASASALLIWQLFSASWPLYNRAWVRNTFEGTVGDFTAPIWPVKLIILIGCAALFIQLILFAASAFFRLIEGKGPET